MIHKEESQQVEFKLIWKDEYLKQLCGFANAHGGFMYIGVKNDCHVLLSRVTEHWQACSSEQDI